MQFEKWKAQWRNADERLSLTRFLGRLNNGGQTLNLDGLTAGQGYIALAALIYASVGRHPLPSSNSSVQLGKSPSTRTVGGLSWSGMTILSLPTVCSMRARRR